MLPTRRWSRRAAPATATPSSSSCGAPPALSTRRQYLETRDAHRAEDLAQETFLVAWRSIGQVEDPKGFRTWLLSVARTVATDDYRRRNRKNKTHPTFCRLVPPPTAGLFEAGLPTDRNQSPTLREPRRVRRAGGKSPARHPSTQGPARRVRPAADAPLHRRRRLRNDRPTTGPDQRQPPRPPEPRLSQAAREVEAMTLAAVGGSPRSEISNLRCQISTPPLTPTGRRRNRDLP